MVHDIWTSCACRLAPKLIGVAWPVIRAASWSGVGGSGLLALETCDRCPLRWMVGVTGRLARSVGAGLMTVCRIGIDESVTGVGLAALRRTGVDGAIRGDSNGLYSLRPGAGPEELLRWSDELLLSLADAAKTSSDGFWACTLKSTSPRSPDVTRSSGME